MRAVVVYESMYGNTKWIAESIAEGIRVHLPVEVIEVGSAPAEVAADIGLLVVGGPTHAFGLSRPSTRHDAAQRKGGSVVSDRIGLREWLAALARPAQRVVVATFDTKIIKPRLPGSGARGAEKRLRRLGFDRAVPPETFYVEDAQGPLVDGELSRACVWGERLGAAVEVPVG